tara:strand:+ start:1464 stop:1652 length:189 start_codon:yes stop_codon:yes gene_type:complete
MTNLEALYLTLFIVFFWGIFGWLVLKIKKALGEKISKNMVILLYAIVLLFPLIFPFIVGWVE